MNQIRLYIAGPMTDVTNENHPAFRTAWHMGLQRGHHMVSPHFLESVIEVQTRVKLGPAAVYRHVLPIDVYALSSCDAVIALPGWHSSKGCKLEAMAADLMGIPWFGCFPAFAMHETEKELKDTLTLAFRQMEERFAYTGNS